MSTPADYPLILALEDFVPTLLAFAGFYLLGGLSGDDRRVRLGRIGAVLIVAGGLAKCAWKIIVATDGPDLGWLAGMLFPLMAAGACLLLWSLHRSMPWWPYALVPALTGIAAVAIGSIQPIFVLATAGITLISITGAVIAARRGAWFAMVLYAVSIIAVMGLVPLRHHPQHETLGFQWIEQGTNTTAQGLFLLAAFLTVRAVARTGGAARPEEVAR
ncbi:hypothetical protein F4553_006769 [Allocatelliglobosispora scoriae]|uniref:Uncharacterized protein n=1 Tax=Allocatelliglobosispora scoriae TaxID=643052 RepID=A0A841C071_9ACTN|nr:hypothetical protein [Allocatelliglobosispora scoriae]MBB5873335.1 hypothetical protein [Allocatelliglobosispora scoriae]